MKFTMSSCVVMVMFLLSILEGRLATCESMRTGVKWRIKRFILVEDENIFQHDAYHTNSMSMDDDNKDEQNNIPLNTSANYKRNEQYSTATLCHGDRSFGSKSKRAKSSTSSKKYTTDRSEKPIMNGKAGSKMLRGKGGKTMSKQSRNFVAGNGVPKSKKSQHSSSAETDGGGSSSGIRHHGDSSLLYKNCAVESTQSPSSEPSATPSSGTSPPASYPNSVSPPEESIALHDTSGSNDNSFLTFLCSIFEENRATCDGKEIACPRHYEQETICSHPHGLSSLESFYCSPMFAPLENFEVAKKCIDFCIAFTAPDTADCCSLSCD